MQGKGTPETLAKLVGNFSGKDAFGEHLPYSGDNDSSCGMALSWPDIPGHLTGSILSGCLLPGLSFKGNVRFATATE